MTAFEDLDARPGSATSLLRTIVGAHLRELGGWVAVADLIRLLDAVGVAPAHARSAVLRVKQKGLLVAERLTDKAGYRLNPAAVVMLESGDRRIFSYRQQGEDDAWCLVSFSVPEAQRSHRHQLRKRLGWIGCGIVANGLWICPAHLVDEVEQILAELRLQDAATLFISSRPRTRRSLAEAAAEWWDLTRIATLHQAFIETVDDAAPGDDRDAFARYIRSLDVWRVIPYLDPGLPPSALPADWPGIRSVDLFARMRSELADRATAFALSVTAGP